MGRSKKGGLTDPFAIIVGGFTVVLFLLVFLLLFLRSRRRLLLLVADIQLLKLFLYLLNLLSLLLSLALLSLFGGITLLSRRRTINLFLARFLPQPPITTIPLAFQVVSQSDQVDIGFRQNHEVTGAAGKVGDELDGFWARCAELEEGHEGRLEAEAGGFIANCLDVVLVLLWNGIGMGRKGRRTF